MNGLSNSISSCQSLGGRGRRKSGGDSIREIMDVQNGSEEPEGNLALCTSFTNKVSVHTQITWRLCQNGDSDSVQTGWGLIFHISNKFSMTSVLLIHSPL